VKRFGGALLGALLAGCGNLPTTSDGVAFLEIIPPQSLTLAVGDTVRIVARALDEDGQPVGVAITWRTPDTTVSVDQAGLVTGLAAGPGRVQAAVGESQVLVSNFIELTVTAPPPQPGRAR
jgi:uncharacterized protein YjdB